MPAQSSITTRASVVAAIVTRLRRRFRQTFLQAIVKIFTGGLFSLGSASHAGGANVARVAAWGAAGYGSSTGEVAERLKALPC